MPPRATQLTAQALADMCRARTLLRSSGVSVREAAARTRLSPFQFIRRARRGGAVGVPGESAGEHRAARAGRGDRPRLSHADGAAYAILEKQTAAVPVNTVAVAANGRSAARENGCASS